MGKVGHQVVLRLVCSPNPFPSRSQTISFFFSARSSHWKVMLPQCKHRRTSPVRRGRGMGRKEVGHGKLPFPATVVRATWHAYCVPPGGRLPGHAGVPPLRLARRRPPARGAGGGGGRLAVPAPAGRVLRAVLRCALQAMRPMRLDPHTVVRSEGGTYAHVPKAVFSSRVRISRRSFPLCSYFPLSSTEWLGVPSI